MKKAILFGLLAVLWLVLKLLLRWFGTPRIGNPAADLALLLVVTAAAILVGVLLMKTEKSADAQEKAKTSDRPPRFGSRVDSRQCAARRIRTPTRQSGGRRAQCCAGGCPQLGVPSVRRSRSRWKIL